MSSRGKKTLQQSENDQLSAEELKLLEDYRAGRLQAPTKSPVVESSDLGALNSADVQIKNFLYEIGMLEERKAYFIEQLASARNLKNNLLQEVMLKYGIPANHPFKINRETGAVAFDLESLDSEV